jgi:predicted ATP-grasp superfamily ATP-dependent carboligase
MQLLGASMPEAGRARLANPRATLDSCVVHSPERAAPPALVFGAYVTGLAVIRAFGRAGVTVYSAGGDRTMIARSRWYRPVPGGDIDDEAGAERLASFLESLPFSRSVLFPCSDRWVLALAELTQVVARCHVPVVARTDVVKVLIDKQRFADAAAALGVPVPRVLEPSGFDTLDAEELHHFFLKPRNSQSFSDRFGVKALHFHSRAHGAEVLAELEDAGIGVLLQEFIPGPPTSHIFLDGYVDRTGVMRACLARRRLRMYPRPFGNSTLSVTIPCAEAASAIESLQQLFAALRYTGLFDAEFKLDARDGQYKILEVNVRPWWQLELAGASGLDVCTMAYRDAIGESIATATSYRTGVTWVNPVPDLTAWWMDRPHADRAGGFPIRAWFTGPNAVFSRDDPAPALDEIARFFRIIVSRGRRRSGPQPVGGRR